MGTGSRSLLPFSAFTIRLSVAIWRSTKCLIRLPFRDSKSDVSHKIRTISSFSFSASIVQSMNCSRTAEVFWNYSPLIPCQCGNFNQLLVCRFIQNSSLCACADAQTQLWGGWNRSRSILRFGTEHGNVAVCCVSSLTALEGLMGVFFSLSMLLVRPGSGSYMRQLEDSRYQKLLLRRSGCVRSPLQNCSCRSAPRHQLDGEMAAFEPASLEVVKTKHSYF